MRFQRSDIFTSKNQNSQIRLQNSSITSPFQSRYINVPQESDSFKILSYKTVQKIWKQKVRNRCNLAIEYIPQFILLSQAPQVITIKIKQYTLELLPWLIKKDPLFKVNLVLGIYIAFLELIDLYGLFPLHPNMMKVNEKQQVAVWINKNFSALEPDQVLTKNAFSIRQFIKSFLRIFKCCLPFKGMSEMYNDPKQLLVELTKIKRKQQMHKNCHEFIKHNTGLNCSRKSNKFQSTSIIQSLKQTPLIQRFSTKPIIKTSISPINKNGRFSSFSPPKRIEKGVNSKQKFNQTTGFKNKPNTTFGGDFFKKKLNNVESQKQDQTRTDQSKKPSICSTGELFKRYLLYNTSKYHKMTKVSTLPVYSSSSRQIHSKQFIFRSQVYRENQNPFSQTIIEQRNSIQVMSQQLLGIDEEKGSFIKFRKMSSNTNERKKQAEQPKKFMNSTGWKKSFKQQENYFFANPDTDENNKNQTKQKLKSSFPYKTASTLNSFRMSNQHQYHIFPSKSEQNLNICSTPALSPLNNKQKDKKIQQMKIVEENELESDFNNIFSMQNSNIRNEEEEKKMETIITEFQQVLF